MAQEETYETERLSGVTAKVVWLTDDEPEPFEALFSFGEYDPDIHGAHDSKGWLDSEVFFHCEPSDIERFRFSDSGEDFLILEVLERFHEW